MSSTLITSLYSTKFASFTRLNHNIWPVVLVSMAQQIWRSFPIFVQHSWGPKQLSTRSFCWFPLPWPQCNGPCVWIGLRFTVCLEKEDGNRMFTFWTTLDAPKTSWSGSEKSILIYSHRKLVKQILIKGTKLDKEGFLGDESFMYHHLKWWWWDPSNNQTTPPALPRGLSALLARWPTNEEYFPQSRNTSCSHCAGWGPAGDFEWCWNISWHWKEEFLNWNPGTLSARQFPTQRFFGWQNRFPSPPMDFLEGTQSFPKNQWNGIANP